MTEPIAPKKHPGPARTELESEVAVGTRTLIVGPYLTKVARRAARDGKAAPSLRSPAARLEEAVGLALAIDLTIVEAIQAPLGEIRPATYLGKGKVEELTGIVKAQDVSLVVMDCALSPIQQRNLEKELGAKVIDRTGLILEIFGQRAHTREGTLQVELAHLAYQKSRLVRSWTHLERQRGGFGFLGGPGETQIEADRRLIQERMSRLERDLEAVKRTRGLHRSGRKKVPYPIVALVGYTNAGKSTLFNRLTRAEVLARDLLFATLDPTARQIRLPHGGHAILSDTVGFISDLPTMLVAAFRATLEDVTEADVILHVRDISHEDAEAQGADVAEVLSQLGIAPDNSGRIVEVWNKADRLDAAERERLANIVALKPVEARPVLVSALSGEGIEPLLAMIEGRLARGREVLHVRLDATIAAETLAWLYRSCEVLERRETPDGMVDLDLRVPDGRAGLVRSRLASAPGIVVCEG